MNIRLLGLLPYVRVDLHHQGIGLSLDQVLVDTGSERSVFSSDEAASIGMTPNPGDRLGRVAGIGGSEWVCWKRLDRIAFGGVSIPDFEVQIGSMNYGFPIQGILGMDFLLQVGAVIDLDTLDIRLASWN